MLEFSTSIGPIYYIQVYNDKRKSHNTDPCPYHHCRRDRPSVTEVPASSSQASRLVLPASVAPSGHTAFVG